MDTIDIRARFSGEPQTRWLTENGPDRQMVLLEDFWFDDGRKRWKADKGTGVDGASIPRALWALVGSPYSGDYRRASIVHDVACVEAGDDGAARLAADRMFYFACCEGGCSPWQAFVLYVGVRIGAKYRKIAALSEERAVKTRPDPIDCEIQEVFSTASEMAVSGPETHDFDEIHRRTEAAIATVAAMRVGLLRTQEALVAGA